MRVNKFKAARRMALALCVSWVAGCVVYGVFATPSVHLSYRINGPDAAPVRVDKCGRDEGSRLLATKDASGNRVRVTLCFKALEAQVHRVGVEASYSLEVARQMDELEERFRLPPEGAAEAQRLVQDRLLQERQYAAIAAVSGLVAGWILVAFVGWAVRGILGIPRGADSHLVLPRPNATSRQRSVDTTAENPSRVKRRTRGHRSRLD